MKKLDFSSLGIEIIDAHVHPAISGFHCGDFTLFDRKTDDETFVATLRRAGIAHCCGSAIARFNPESFDGLCGINDRNVAFARKSGGFYIPAAMVHPGFQEESCRELELMHREHNVRFVGELVGYCMGYNDYTVAAFDPVWSLIRDLGMAVNVHLNRLEEARILLERFPGLKLIIAHPTASPAEYDARLDLIAKYENAALDISGSGPNMWGMLRRGISRAGREKILFGTDFPLRNPAMYVAGVLSEDLSDDELEAVFSGNFKRLTGYAEA